MNRRQWIAIASTTVGLLTVIGDRAVQADSIVPAADGTGTQVNQTGGDHTITGGSFSADQQNLFHSFTEFTLLTGESATFITDPTVLNILSRVTGGNPSLIDGLLQVSGSNANLLLMNPSGVLFGPNSALNLGGSFTTVTADQVNFTTGAFGTVGTPDYSALVGNPQIFTFSADSPGSVVNGGTLAVPTGEAVILLGGQVINTGTIAAPAGDILISAVDGNRRVRITQEGMLLNLEVAALPAAAAVSPLPFTPLSLPELLTGNAIAEAAGVTVDADGSVRLTDGEVALPIASGTAIATGRLDTRSDTVGGNLTVLGETVGLLAAVLDASGTTGGGSIRIGGDYKGEGPLPTATVTVVDGASSLTADAIETGDGGDVIIWSDQTTRSYGTLSARGGAIAGDGGLVETSSRGVLETQGVPDVSAPAGNNGLWLLDPATIELINGTGGNFNQATLPPTVFSPLASSGTSFINLNDINTALANGNVSIVTSPFDPSATDGSIVFSDGFVFTAGDGNVLSLEAVGDILVENSVDVLSSANISLRADSDGDGSGRVVISSFFSTSGGDITITGQSLTTAPAIESFFPISSNGGNISLRSDTGDIEVVAIDASLFGNVGGNITITTPQFLRVTSSPSIETTGGASITITHGGNGITPFSVGDASVNGTFERIANGNNTIATGQSFLGNFSLGNIGIFTNVAGGEDPDPGSDGSPDSLSDTFDDFDCVEGCDDLDSGLDDSFDEGLDEGFFDDDIFEEDLEAEDFEDEDFEDEDFDEEGFDETVDNFDGEEVSNEFDEISYDDWEFDDSLYADEFVDYFDLPAVSEPDFTAGSDTLQLLADLIGVPPALVYARFVPAGAETLALRSQTKQGLPVAPQPTDTLQLILVTPEGQPQQIRVPEATREKVTAAVRQLQIELTDRTRRRTNAYLEPAQALYGWLVRPLESKLEAAEIGHLSFIMASGLRSLPLAALHDGDQFIIENYTVGLMPSLALTDTRYTDLRQAPVLAMGASEFTDQPDLPAVPFELNTIVEQLRPGTRNLNETFTPPNLVTQRRAAGYSILHLATHGEFRTGGPENSYIQFWDQRLALNQIQRLQLNDPPLELLVMSACRTALGDSEAELGFAGLAVQAGVKSALATLWQVSDLETAGLMAEFYTQLGQQSYRAEALRQAQLAMLRGEVTVQDDRLIWSGGSQPLPPELVGLRFGDTQHPYFWSAFTLVGSPW